MLLYWSRAPLFDLCFSLCDVLLHLSLASLMSIFFSASFFAFQLILFFSFDSVLVQLFCASLFVMCFSTVVGMGITSLRPCPLFNRQILAVCPSTEIHAGAIHT